MRKIEIPFPPTLNSQIRGGHYLPREVREYREQVVAVVWDGPAGRIARGTACGRD